MIRNTQMNPAHPPAPNPTVDALVFMLNKCGLDEHLHDRALYAADKKIWRDGYLRGRPQKHIVADLAIRKARVHASSAQRLNLREQIIEATFHSGGFSLPGALGFMTWAEKVNHPNQPEQMLAPSPFDAAERRNLLAYLFVISFDISQADAYTNLDRLRKRDLDEIRTMTALVSSNAPNTRCFMAIAKGFSAASSLSFGARNPLFTKKSLEALKIKLALIPTGSGGSVVGVDSGAVGAISTIWTGIIYGLCTPYRMACLARALWRDLFDFSRAPLHDAAILGIITALNDRFARQDQIIGEIEINQVVDA